MVTILNTKGNPSEGWLERKNNRVVYHYENGIVLVHLHQVAKLFTILDNASARLIGAMALGQERIRRQNVSICLLSK